MLNPLEIKQLKTVNEVFKSDKKIYIVEKLHPIYEENEIFKIALKENRIVYDEKFTLENYYDPNWIYFEDCDLGTFNNYNLKHRKRYMIMNPVNSEPSIIFLGYVNPFLEKFQYLMDWCVQGGLHVHAFTITKHIFSIIEETYRIDGIKEELLNFSQITFVFYVLLIGHSIAGFVLLCEIFYHDFVRNLSKKFLKRKLKKLLLLNEN